MGLQEELKKGVELGVIPQELADSFFEFYHVYLREGKKSGGSDAALHSVLEQFVQVVLDQIRNPFEFEIFHKQIREPFDYYAFGLNVFRPLIDFTKSKIYGTEHLQTIEQHINKGENVVLLSNHQIEPDPQAINLMLEKSHPKLAANMIFVAGHRVVTDPVAVPFSKGVNLLCIYSKNYIENPPEQKHAKLSHNRRTMQKMVELLSEGGKCIYVAPSGGRDRPDAQGMLNVSPFDPNSIEMFRLMAKQADTPTHFHTLALSTHHLQPPPKTVEEQLGEKRIVNYTPVHLAFGPEIDMDSIVAEDKAAARKARADFIWNQAQSDYRRLISL